MEMNPDAPGNISQKGVSGQADNETGVANDSVRKDTGGKPIDEELGFDTESPDVSDPAVDPVKPALTSNDPVPSRKR